MLLLHSNYEVNILLWGSKAAEFDADYICEISQGEPVIAIFVGLLVKPFQGIYPIKPI